MLKQLFFQTNSLTFASSITPTPITRMFRRCRLCLYACLLALLCCLALSRTIEVSPSSISPRTQISTSPEGEGNFADGRHFPLTATAFRPFTSTSYVGHSRPVRLLPTNVSGQERAAGRGCFGGPYSFARNLPFFLRQIDMQLMKAAAPPRFYFVIALRRILC